MACTFIEPETGDRLTACVDGDSDPNVKVSFAKDIRPIINGLVPGPKPCANCHFPNSGTHEGFDQTGLDLTTLRWLRRGGTRTADDIVVPGQPCKSAIIQKLRVAQKWSDGDLADDFARATFRDRLTDRKVWTEEFAKTL